MRLALDTLDGNHHALSGIMFTRGQSDLTQVAMAVSSRSMARRVGFCGLQPKACNRACRPARPTSHERSSCRSLGTIWRR